MITVKLVRHSQRKRGETDRLHLKLFMPGPTLLRDAGYGKDRENARRFLRMGQIYTVERTVVFSDITIVFLQEYPGIPFNSVQFKDLKH